MSKETQANACDWDEKSNNVLEIVRIRIAVSRTNRVRKRSIPRTCKEVPVLGNASMENYGEPHNRDRIPRFIASIILYKKCGSGTT